MDFTQDELPRMFESLSIANISDPKIRSPFECLPSELILSIFNYVPEAICELRLTSKTLKVLVDEFVRHRATIPLVHHIGIHDLYYEENGPSTIRIFIDVPVRVASLFELGLKYREVNRTARISRRADGNWEPFGYMNSYWLDGSISVTNGPNTDTWERLAESIGPRARIVELNISKNTDLERICSFLERLKIDEIEFNIKADLSEIDANLLLKTIKHHNVEWLALRTTTVSTSVWSEFLLELSTQLRSLYIRGNCEDDINWAPLVIVMFSRKLEKLQVDNWPNDILSREDADRLIAIDLETLNNFFGYNISNKLQHLPFIGKKVWFKANFSRNSVGRSNKLNGHIIHETCPIRRPNRPLKYRTLSIIHKSRRNEASPSGY